MKLHPLLVAGSLAANLAFVVFGFVKLRPLLIASSAATAVSPRKVSTPAPTAAQLAQTWHQLQPDDLPALVAQLRALGFPPSVVRAIITERVSQLFAARRQALPPPPAALPYWKRGQSAATLADDTKRRAAQQALTTEQNRLLHELLGPDAAPENDDLRAYQRRSYGPLPPEKLDALFRIKQDYADLTNQIAATAQGVFLPGDRERLAYLATEQLKDIKTLLTPDEFTEYRIHDQMGVAGTLRNKLTVFDPTEQEFRLIFNLSQELDDRYNTPPRPTLSRREAEEQLAAQIKAQLGPERGAEFALTYNPDYQQLGHLVARLELPRETTRQVFDLKTSIEQRATAIQVDTTLAPEQRAAQLASLAQEATTKITATLGARGFEAYRQYGGAWLDQLSPR